MKEKGGEKREDSLAIILHSSSYDRADYVLSIAIVALAMGMNVHMLFTYEGLKRLVKGHTEDLNGSTEEAIRTAIEKGLKNGNIQPLSRRFKEAKRMGLKIYACVNAMAIFNVSKDELVSEVDKPMGLATFLELAKDAAVTLYV